MAKNQEIYNLLVALKAQEPTPNAQELAQDIVMLDAYLSATTTIPLRKAILDSVSLFRNLDPTLVAQAFNGQNNNNEFLLARNTNPSLSDIKHLAVLIRVKYSSVNTEIAQKIVDSSQSIDSLRAAIVHNLNLVDGSEQFIVESDIPEIVSRAQAVLDQAQIPAPLQVQTPAQVQAPVQTPAQVPAQAQHLGPDEDSVDEGRLLADKNARYQDLVNHYERILKEFQTAYQSIDEGNPAILAENLYLIRDMEGNLRRLMELSAHISELQPKDARSQQVAQNCHKNRDSIEQIASKLNGIVSAKIELIDASLKSSNRIPQVFEQLEELKAFCHLVIENAVVLPDSQKIAQIEEYVGRTSNQLHRQGDQLVDAWSSKLERLSDYIRSTSLPSQEQRRLSEEAGELIRNIDSVTRRTPQLQDKFEKAKHIYNDIERQLDELEDKNRVAEQQLAQYQINYQDINQRVTNHFSFIANNDATLLGANIDYIVNAADEIRYLKDLLEQVTTIQPPRAPISNSPNIQIDLEEDDLEPRLADEIKAQISFCQTTVDEASHELVQVAHDKLGLVTRDLAAVGTAHNLLERQASQAQQHVQDITSVIRLLQSGDADSNVITKVKRIQEEAELAHVQLQIRSASELADEASTQLKAIRNQIESADILYSDEKKKLLVEANRLLTEIDSKSTQAETEITALKAQRPTQPLTPEDDARIEHVKKQREQAQADFLAAKARLESRGGNLFMAKGDPLDTYFHDVKIVKKGKAPEAAPNPDALAIAAASARGIAAGQHQVIYKKVQLEEGDVIRAQAVFSKVGEPLRRGILEQDHLGKVTDRTDRTGQQNSFSPEEAALLALKQAKMLLDNYAVDAGDIVISGGAENVEQAKKVYAALLYLKEGNPKFKDIKINSTVPGCKLPEAGYFTREATVRANFINANLLRHLGDNLANKQSGSLPSQIKSEVKAVVEARISRIAEFKEQYNAAKNSPVDADAAKQKVKDKYNTKEEGGEYTVDQLGPINRHP